MSTNIAVETGCIGIILTLLFISPLFEAATGLHTGLRFIKPRKFSKVNLEA